MAAARKSKRNRAIVRFVVSAVVVLALLFGWSLLADDSGDSGDDTATGDTSATTAATDDTTTTTAAPEYTNPELAEEVLARGAPEIEAPPEDTPADTLESETLIEGEGDAAVAGDSITVHYIGKLSDDTVFDQSWEGGEAFTVEIGTGQVITGWDEGLIGVKIGEQRSLVLGADNAYGDQEAGEIPANSPLSFVVDVVDIQPGTGSTETTTAP